MEPVNPLVPPVDNVTYGYMQSSPLYLESAHWNNYQNSMITTLQSKSATSQSVNAYMTSINVGHYRLAEWQNDMQITLLKSIQQQLQAQNEASAALKLSFDQLSTSISNSTPAGESVTNNQLMLLLIGLVIWRIIAYAMHRKTLLHSGKGD